jgi:hypothetical protein
MTNTVCQRRCFTVRVGSGPLTSITATKGLQGIGKPTESGGIYVQHNSMLYPDLFGLRKLLFETYF